MDGAWVWAERLPKLGNSSVSHSFHRFHPGFYQLALNAPIVSNVNNPPRDRSQLLLTKLALFLSGLLLGLVFVSCFGPKREPRVRAEPVPSAHADNMTVLVAWDGVRWQEVFEGVDAKRARASALPKRTSPQLLPNLYQLVSADGCAIGSPQAATVLSATGPNYLSLPGYTEMFTGASPVGCHDNDCGQVTSRTIADDAVSLDTSLGAVAVITSWPRIERAASVDPKTMIISAGRTHGSNQQALHRSQRAWKAYQQGRAADPAPGFGDFRPDRYTAELALAYLEDFAPRFLFVGLGETDEYAHHNDYPKYIDALRRADETVGKIHRILERAEVRGVSTTLFVTSDHGRSGFIHHGGAYPSSSRSWLVAAGSTISCRGFVHSPEPRRLADLGPTLRALWGLDPRGLQRDSSVALRGSVLVELFNE